LKIGRPIAERVSALDRERLTRCHVPDGMVEEWIPWEPLEQKKKSPPSRNRLSIGRLPTEPDAHH
jgi:hypothetical protein